MKNKFLVLSVLFVLLIACKNDKPQKEKIQNKKAIKHYICENKCENSGSDEAGVCPTCNTPYKHNEAFHANDFLKNGPLKVQENRNTTKTASPAQNRYGFYHYVCNNGCPNGAGSAENCKTCGEQLIHNQAYHNQ